MEVEGFLATDGTRIKHGFWDAKMNAPTRVVPLLISQNTNDSDWCHYILGGRNIRSAFNARAAEVKSETAVLRAAVDRFNSAWGIVVVW